MEKNILPAKRQRAEMSSLSEEEVEDIKEIIPLTQHVLLKNQPHASNG
jgi:hypothetical protein